MNSQVNRFSFGEMIDYNVYTRTAIKNINDIAYGDEVINYGSSKLMKVIALEQTINSPSYIVTYNDGRKVIFSESEYIFTSSGILTINEHPENFNIPTCVFNNNYIILKTDPYALGGLFAYGDYNDEYINLPTYSYHIINHMCNKYNISTILAEGSIVKVYFTDIMGNKIKWNDYLKNVFRCTYFEKIDTNFMIRNIGRIMTMSSLNIRRQFISGIFDASPYQYSGENIELHLEDECRLKVISNILNSYGILNRIEYLPNDQGCDYTLFIEGSYKHKPEFFYNLQKIYVNIDSNNKILNHDSINTWQIKSIKKDVDRYMLKLIFEEPNQIFISDNFIPRVSG